MKYLKFIFSLAVLLTALPSANATIINGSVTYGSGTFKKLLPGFTDSNPDNTVGSNNFQNLNLYGFDEDQNTEVLNNPLNVNLLASTGTSGTLAIGTVVASHYLFFDPLNTVTQRGWVDFDSDIIAIISSTANLNASDYLANTGVTYLNPGLRGLEGGDHVTIDAGNARRINVDWTASSPGDYVRILTTYSPGGVIPEPGTLALLAIGFAGIRCRRNKK